jgi:signal transduction histidine kinase
MVTRLKKSIRHEMLGMRSDAGMVEGSFLDQVRQHVDYFQSQCDLPVDFQDPTSDEADRVPLEVGMQLLRVLQEALANAYLHAHATRVTVRLLVAQTKVRFEVEDDGDGFDPESIPDSRLGLRIMRERMEQVDGSLEIGPAASGGTKVVAEAPLLSLSRVPLPVDGHV